ncbi:hypothetical protein [Plantactinospora sp. KBS50]|uniref:hypothetical protein n=1 Tax=Plantactinospora sp. KBS50 TaxID=2024580 RepID=UPI0012FDBF0D|nr:hypothetical protein [Plantactinospora sp. KBS50]
MTSHVLLSVRDLAIDVDVPRGDAGLVRDVSFTIGRGRAWAWWASRDRASH